MHRNGGATAQRSRRRSLGRAVQQGLCIIVGVCAALQITSYLSSAKSAGAFNQDSATITDPSYRPRPAKSCTPAPLVSHHYPRTTTCIRVVTTTRSSLHLELTPLLSEELSSWPVSLSVTLSGTETRDLTTEFAPAARVAYTAANLTACTWYSATVVAHHSHQPRVRPVCTAAQLATACSPQGNAVRNPSFEVALQAPFAATRHGTTMDQRFNPAGWTPFYDGGGRRACGRDPIPPRSGNCALLLGGATENHAHYGSHTAVPLVDATGPVIVVAWTARKLPPPDVAPAEPSVVVSWTLNDGSGSDGVIVPLQHAGDAKWTPVCIVLQQPAGSRLRALHLFFHLDAARSEPSVARDDLLAVDDVTVHAAGGNAHIEQLIHSGVCYSATVQSGGGDTSRRPAPEVHLRAATAPGSGALTLAVPLTAGRVLRLETLSRQYGGGGIVAAVAVRSMAEAVDFAVVWASKAWLRMHVNVTFVLRTDTDGALAINALRNVAVALARTRFVSMLDVDMTPAPAEFDCMRDGGAYLAALQQRQLLAMSVLVPDVHARAPASKCEARDALVQHAAFFYCVNSQRAGRLRHWVAADDDSAARQTRFTADYEPYVVARRDAYPVYDERFCGYGFNKISWLMQADAADWAIYALPRPFVTHLNHVENDWVSAIDERRYLQTWRRYLALVAEVGDLAFGGATRRQLEVVE